MKINSLTIVGTSANEEKFGYKALRKALEEGIEVYAVNPNKKDILVMLSNGERREISPLENVEEIPKATDFVALYIPRKTILEGSLLDQIASKEFPNVIVPPDESFSEETIKLGETIRDRLKNKGYDDSQILIDVCYLRGL